MLIVRGAAKALQMSDALRAYVLALSSVPVMLQEAEVGLLEIRGGDNATTLDALSASSYCDST